MSPTKVSVKAPCRIDLAGGTIDLWPLYLYFGGLELVQMGVSVFADAQVEWKPTKKKSHKIIVTSDDMKTTSTYDSLEELKASLKLSTKENPLRWVDRVSHHVLSQKTSYGEWKIRTRSDAPPGSGLGGSSVLGIALHRALQKALKIPAKDLWAVQTSTRDLEAIEIEHPAGDQDYVPALFGGLIIFKLNVSQREIERLPTSKASELGSRLALLYTGKPHHSGINNWQVFQNMHARENRTVDSLIEIHDIAQAMAEELRGKKVSYSKISELLNLEWAARQKLSPAVGAPVLDDAWDYAHSQGAVARKACGSGGGGCMLMMFDSQKARDKAVKAPLPQSDWKWLPTSPATKGTG